MKLQHENKQHHHMKVLHLEEEIDIKLCSAFAATRPISS